jgi:hypothetical protein
MDVNERVLDTTVTYPIHCCICLNGKQGRVPAVLLIRGYAACEQHVETVRKQDFDISKLLRLGRNTT